MYYQLAQTRRDLVVVVLGNFHRKQRKNGSVVHIYNLERRLKMRQLYHVVKEISQNIKELNEQCTIRINISKNPIEPRELKFVTDAQWSNRVQMVTLTGIKLFFYGGVDLSASKWKHLKKINLSHMNIEDYQCVGIGLAKWPQLQSINLSYNKITFQGCASLSAPRWFKLQHLNISDNGIGDAGVQHLCKGPWAILQHVDLSQNNLSCKSCKYITQANWRKIHFFNLQSNSIRDKGLQFLSKNVWSHLHILNLRGNLVGSKGIIALSKLHFIANKRSKFDFTNNKYIDDRACPSMLRSQFSYLPDLYLRGNNIKRPGYRILRSNIRWIIHWDATQ